MMQAIWIKVRHFFLMGLMCGLLFSCNNKPKHDDTLIYKLLPNSDLYASLDLLSFLDFVQENGAALELKLPFAPADLGLLYQRLKTSGVNASQCYFAASPEVGAFHLIASVENYKTLKSNLDDLAFFTDWDIFTEKDQIRYDLPASPIAIILSKNVLYISTTEEKIAFDRTVNSTLSSEFFGELNALVYKGSHLKDFGLEEMRLTFDLSQGVDAVLTLIAESKLPISSSEKIQLPLQELNSHFTTNWDVTNLKNLPNRNAIIQLGNDFVGISLFSALPHWNGYFSFELGDSISVTQSNKIIDFDENFEEIIRVETTENIVPAVRMLIGFSDLDSLEQILLSTGLLIQNQDNWFFPFLPPLTKTVCQENNTLVFESVHKSLECNGFTMDPKDRRNTVMKWPSNNWSLEVKERFENEKTLHFQVKWRNLKNKLPINSVG